MAREIMRTHDLIFASRPLLKNAEILLYGRMDMAFSPYGEHWRQLKKLCTIHLLSTKRVQSYKLAREEEVAFMVKNITQCSLLHAPIDMSEVLFSFVNDNICRLVSGKFLREGGRNHFFRKAIEEIVTLLGGFRVEDYFPSLAWLEGWFLGLSKRARRAFKIWDDVLDEVIKEHENRDKDDGEKDFVDVLLSLQKDPNMDFELKKEHIKAILVDMFVGGTDTSYIVLEWAMAELVRNPNIMKKLQNEVREVTMKSGTISENDLNTMTYLKAVIKETLRLHPPAPLLTPRESMKDCYIKDYFIPKNTRVIINDWAISRDPKYWDAPDEFRPERFINSSIDFRGNDFQFIPFGAGRRGCPGMQFAVSTVELALANLVCGFEWELARGAMEERELHMTEAPGLTNRMEKRLMLFATPIRA
ncbi:cytochrome P450 71A1-like [Ananas comosus]|uniref:Cytochrome P450 71A1-like n=1 Tax=Ananas comosus TaxID=4615 RepID=A0A6P5FM17_ANACO|nr:cytochrome P450 71A1-like [Ananas comosus]